MTYYKDINLKQFREKNPNTNFLSPNNFEVVIDNITYPSATYNIVQLAIPGFDINRTDTAFATRNTHFHADKVSYQDFVITFLVDENLDNYMEIHDWMLAQVIQNDNYPNDGKRRDIKIIINSSHNNQVRVITINDAFPTNIGEIQLDSQITDIGYATCQVTFAYTYFTVSDK